MDRSLIDPIWQRANNIYEYCRVAQPFDLLRFQIDHIIARKHHGTDAPDNLALACFACNNHKGPNIASIDRDSGELVRLFDPRRDKWTEHFRWEGAVLVGMTPTGRVTVDVLAINLHHRIQLREALIPEGVFPPRDDEN